MLGVGGQMTDNLGRVHEDFASITSHSVDPWGVNQKST